MSYFAPLFGLAALIRMYVTGSVLMGDEGNSRLASPELFWPIFILACFAEIFFIYIAVTAS